MSDTRPANFSSVWADLRGVSFKQHYTDAGGVRIRCIESGDPSKPLVLALHGVGGHAEAYSRNFGPHADHFWFVAIDMLGPRLDRSRRRRLNPVWRHRETCLGPCAFLHNRV